MSNRHHPACDDWPPVRFQAVLLRWQLRQEQDALAAAHAKLADGSPFVVIVYDRGAMDGQAFCDSASWQAAMDANDVSQ